MVGRYAQVEALIREEPPPAGAQPAMAELHRLCRAAARALEASGAGLTVMAGNSLRGVSAASDPATERLEELQVTLGEGPCLDAYRLHRPVLIPDLAGAAMTRWPGYAPAAHALGARAVFAFPLQIGAARLGILDVFRAHPGALAPVQLTVALTFAEVAVATLLSRQASAGGGDGLGDPLESRSELFQAQGMVMVQLGVDLAEAMVRIRAYAFAHNRSLAQVAADVVARRLAFRPDFPGPRTPSRYSDPV